VHPENLGKSCLRFNRQHLACGSPIAGATDPPWSIKIRQLKPKILIQLDDSRCRLIRNYYRPRMSGEQPRGAHLIVPRKTARAVSRELYIIRRISVDKIFRLNLQTLNIFITEPPLPENCRIVREIRRVVNGFVSAERHVEVAALIETAQTVEARAIQIVEQLRAFPGVRLAVPNQPVEPVAVFIEKFLVVAHRDMHPQAVLQVTIEIDEVRVDVVEQRFLWLQAEHDCKAAAKRLHVSPVSVRFPDRLEI
jgi:hypothetical protein